jgi:Secretion system C-terminal sorting domain
MHKNWIAVGFGLFCRLLASETVVGQGFVRDDKLIGVNFFQVEFSGDGTGFTWCKQLPIPGGFAEVYFTTVDKTAGLPRLAQAQLVDTIQGQGWPYWGEDDQGPFFLLMNRRDSLKLVRVSASGQLTPTALVGPGPHERSLINVSSDSRLSHFWISYVVLSADFVNGYDSLFVLRSDAPTQPVFVAREEARSSGSTYALTFPRWLQQSEVLAFPFWPTGLPLYDMKFWYGSSRTSRRVTFDSQTATDKSHIDDLPFVLGSAPTDTFMFSSKSATSLSIYKKPGAAVSFSEFENYAPLTTLGTVTLTSFEPFTLPGDRTYGAYQVYTGGGFPGNTPGEIWLKSILGDTLHIRISNKPGNVAVDPEFLVGTDSVWVFYYGRAATTDPYSLRRCATPLIVNTVTSSENPLGNAPEVNVYPNPASSELNLAGRDGATYQYVLFDISGRQVAAGAFRSQVQLALGQQAAGLYLLKTTDATGQVAWQRIVLR